MRSRWMSIGLLIGILAQFGVLGSILVRREIVLRQGQVCRFKTAPVDPFDAFRGNYVQLDFDALRSGVLSKRSFQRGQWCYLKLGTDTNGFTVVEEIFGTRAAAGPVFLRVRCRYAQTDSIAKPLPHDKFHMEPTGKYRIYLDLPFDRYYMPEKLAPQAEAAYRKANRNGKREAFAVVRVWRGISVIEDVMIDGKPVREALRK